MTNKEIKKLIDEIVSKYSKKAWLNPYDTKEYIPDENILPLKQELYDMIMLTKENK